MGQTGDNPGDVNKHPVSKLTGPFEAPHSDKHDPAAKLQQLNKDSAVDCKAVYRSHKDASQVTALEFDSCYYGHTDKHGKSLELKVPVMHPDANPPKPHKGKDAPEPKPKPGLESITTEGVTTDSRMQDVYVHALPAVRPLSFKGTDGKNWGGTGSMVSDDGLMITNHHVIEKSNGTLQVKLLRPDGTEETRNAHVVMDNKKQDLALLQVDRQPNEKFAFLPLSQATAYREREPMVEMGNANGEGKISMARTRYGTMIHQSDTKLNDPDVLPDRTLYTGQAVVPHGYSGGTVLSVPGSDKDFDGTVTRTGTSAIRGFTVYSDLEKTSYFIPAARGQFMLDEYRKQQAEHKKQEELKLHPKSSLPWPFN